MRSFKRKLRLIYLILFCEDHILISKKKGDVTFNFKMDEGDIEKYTWVLHDHIKRGKEIQSQIDEILL